jgi:hypothetical protein
MPIPTGTAAISFSQLRSEMHTGLGNPGAYSSFPLNDGTFRSRLTDTAVNGTLSLSSLRGNAYQRFTIAADYNTTYDIRTALVNTGWTTTSKGSADVVVNGGIYVSSSSTGAYGMDTGGPWPGPSTIVVYNNGFILGMGGAGGNGGEDDFNNAQPGNAGGPALRAQRAMTLVNSGTIGGGGGGGGGGDGTTGVTPLPPPFSPLPFNNGGGGGGGGRTGRTNSAGGGPGPADGPNANPGGAGQVGTITAGGTGGPGAGTAGAGGTGGNWGTAGNNGGIGNAPAALAGGAAGISVQGWSVVTVPTTGTILGPTAG